MEKTKAKKHFYIDSKEKHFLYQMLKSQRLAPKAIKPMVNALGSLEKNHGIAYVIDRLKLMKMSLLKQVDETLTKEELRLFKGPFASLLTLARKSRRDFIRALRICCIYNRWCAHKATTKHWETFCLNISKETPKHGLHIRVSKKDRKVAKLIFAKSDFTDELPSSAEKVVPLSFELYGHRFTEAELDMLDHLDIAEQTSFSVLWRNREFLDRHLFPGTLIPYLNKRKRLRDLHRSYRTFDDNLVGKIGTILTDGGMKVRFIANPSRIYQVATTRLQDWALRYLKSLPESSAHNAESSWDWVSDHLRKKRRLFSLDLSSATDHFPLDLQYQLLQELLPEEAQADIQLWHDICKGEWSTPIGNTQYNCGQPMGTAPSFPVFAITHVMLLRTLGGDESNFKVLGDDVVIACPKLALRYQDALHRLEVKISLAKSLLDATIAEFAGRIIDKVGMMPVFKGRRSQLNKDYLGYARQYGLSSIPLLYPKRDQELVTLACKVQYGPYTHHVYDKKFHLGLPDDLFDTTLSHDKGNMYSNRDLSTLIGFPQELNFEEKGDKTYLHNKELAGPVKAKRSYTKDFTRRNTRLGALLDSLKGTAPQPIHVRGNANNVPLIEHINRDAVEQTISKDIKRVFESGLVNRTSACLEFGTSKVSRVHAKHVGRLLSSHLRTSKEHNLRSV